MSKTLCLNMIVKNESHIINDTLIKLIEKIKFDYYVICDTGSTDNTIEIIKNFFNNKGIPGEIHQHQWKNFGYNRTLALKASYKKTDYNLIFDADDYIDGDLILPDLVYDGYMLKLGNKTSAYERMLLVKNDIAWKYNGVLHEYITTEITDLKISTGNIEGNYFIVSGRTSSRNKDPLKYIKDAEILEKGYQDSLNDCDGLHNRYAYYCANSYLDAGSLEKATEWYKITLKCNGWFDERYNSCLKLYNLTGNLEYLIQSYHHNPRRVEGIYLLVRHYTCENMYSVAMGYYNFIKYYYENEYIKDNLSTKLFANVMDYTFFLPYYMIIVCEKMRDYSTGLKMYEIIFEKMSTAGQWWSDNLLFNIQFYNYKSLKGLNGYIKFLESISIKIPDLPHLEEFKTKTIEIKFDLLIYTGFSNNLWNYTYSTKNALGGSERAVIYLSRHFPKNWKIAISGDVQDEIIDNVHYINRYNNFNNYKFDHVIVSRYVSFFTIFNNLFYNNLFLMAHDTHFMNNILESTETANEIIISNKTKINGIVYLTEWQREYYENISHPECREITSFIINNGICLELFPKKYQKQSNTFIYTSGSFRGLKRVLDLWEEIIDNLPDAKLNICSYEDFPKNDEDKKMLDIINKYNSIEHLGKLNTSELYKLMDISEYWLYPCIFNETSCITALEMLMSEVICLYYPIAGLKDTMQDYGIKIKENNEIQSLLDLSLKDKMKLRKRGKIYAESCSWENRASQWKSQVLNLNRKKRLLFYARDVFPEIFLSDYLNSLSTLYDLKYTTVIKGTDYDYYDELIYVHEIHDKTILGKFKEIGYFNTEPLNINIRLQNVQNVQNVPENIKIYDYSLGNIKIMKEHHMKNELIYLPYTLNPPENKMLKSLKLKYKKTYDFGIICSGSCYLYNNKKILNPPRRRTIVENLITKGFTVNIISGFGKSRDIELAKCKTILNIHGQFINENVNVDEPAKIFEHIRCNRLLDAGYHILSEDSYEMDQSFKKYNNLIFKSYDTILNLNKHSIVDGFTFYNELDMLSYRLNTLYEIVDYFILVEATLTHVGKPKILYYQENKSLFEKFQDKIIHIVVDDFPFDESNINFSRNEQWVNEKFQRNCIQRGFSKIDKFDYLIVSDVDEIPDPHTIHLIKTGQIIINNGSQLQQDFYYYNIETKMHDLWYYSKVVNYNWFLTTNFTLDDIRMRPFKIIRNGGWHLSYFGDTHFIKNKIKNFAHQEFNLDRFTDERNINYRMENGIDIYDRDLKISKVKVKDNLYIPPYYNNSYCFIHSCNNGNLKRLQYLMDRLKSSGIIFKTIYINNIGQPIKDFTQLTNYSTNCELFEIPTINKIIEFSKLNRYDSVLYLHTKGVSYREEYKEVDDWIDLMLHFLLMNKNLLNHYDCIGCNYKQQPKPHFSGNFWWANCNYLSGLPILSENLPVNKNDAEFHLFQNNPDYYCLHYSGVDHYCQRYPKENYLEFE